MSIIHEGKDTRDVYYLYKTNYDTTKNATFFLNNWNKNQPSSSLIFNIMTSGAAVWLTADGNINYRLAPNGKIFTGTIDKASLVLSNVLGYAIEIKKKPNPKPKPLQNVSPYSITYLTELLTTSLLLITEDKFDPTQVSEFYELQNTYYRNTFIPTRFLTNFIDVTQKIYVSITLQYIYHLSSYDNIKFKYLMNWLASFFKNLSHRSSIPIVLYGGK